MIAAPVIQTIKTSALNLESSTPVYARMVSQLIPGTQAAFYPTPPKKTHRVGEPDAQVQWVLNCRGYASNPYEKVENLFEAYDSFSGF
jgi:hypothetical protein